MHQLSDEWRKETVTRPPYCGQAKTPAFGNGRSKKAAGK